MDGNSPADSNPTPSLPAVARQFVPLPVSVVIGVGLLIGVIVLDIYRPFDQVWSNLYFLVAVYAGTFLRGRLEVLLYGLIIISALLVPSLLRPDSIWLGSGLLNRIAGVVCGLIMVALIWSRRDFIEGLRLLNQRLEAKVSERTSELQLTNSSLQFEITERQKTQEELRSSRERLEVLSRQLITTLETERRHIARELHDEIGQILTAIKMNLRRTQGAADAGLQLQLEENVEMVDQAIGHVRNLSLSLRPPQLDELGLAAALHWLLKHQSRFGDFVGQLKIDLIEVTIPPDLETVCFRIVQEALTNAVRHARPSTLVVKLWATNDELCLSVHDDGIGFDVDEVRQRALEGGSVGLISMSERASLVGGRLDIESTAERGTTIHASFPLSASG